MVLNLVYINIKFGMEKTKVEYCVSFHFLVSVNQQKPKEAEPMEKEPIIIHICQMLREFNEGPLRAFYMIVKEYHELQKAQNKGG